MNRLTGTATLEYRGDKRQVHVCLDLENNAIEVRHAMPDLDKAMLSVTGREWHTSPAILTDIRISTPIGTIVKDRLEDVFVMSYSPGTHSIYDATLSRALTLRGKEEGITRIVLHPRSSRVEFDFQPFDTLSPQFELFYRCAKSLMPMPQELHLNPGRAVVVGDNRSLVVRGDQQLSHREEIIRLSLSILHGGPITIRSILEDKKLTINLATHDGGSLGPLYKKYDDAGPLLQGSYDYLAALSPSDWAQWRRGIYFFLQGLGGIAPLEIRAINFFTYLEIIDNNATLDKNSLSSILNVTTDEADLLCRTRNRLIHRGEHIGAAVLNAEELISAHRNPLINAIFTIDPTNEHKTGISFFFKFARLLNSFWIQEAAFTGEWNDYSEYDV